MCRKGRPRSAPTHQVCPDLPTTSPGPSAELARRASTSQSANPLATARGRFSSPTRRRTHRSAWSVMGSLKRVPRTTGHLQLHPTSTLNSLSLAANSCSEHPGCFFTETRPLLSLPNLRMDFLEASFLPPPRAGHQVRPATSSLALLLSRVSSAPKFPAPVGNRHPTHPPTETGARKIPREAVP